MNKLFPAAKAIKFVVGCHAKCSSLERKLQENSLVLALEFSCPAKSERVDKFGPQIEVDQNHISKKVKEMKITTANNNHDDKVHASGCLRMTF